MVERAEAWNSSRAALQEVEGRHRQLKHLAMLGDQGAEHLCDVPKNLQGGVMLPSRGSALKS